MTSSLVEGRKRLCVCDYAGAVAALEGEWPGPGGDEGSLERLESGAALAAALRGRAASPATADGRRSVRLLRNVVRADRQRGFRLFGTFSKRASYLSAEAFWFDAAQGRALAERDVAAALDWVDSGLDLFRDFPFPRPQAAVLWVERARYLHELGRADEAREAADTALRAERMGVTASPSSITIELRAREEAEDLLALTGAELELARGVG